MQKGDYRWSVETAVSSDRLFRWVLEKMKSSKRGDFICAGQWRKGRGVAKRDLGNMRALMKFENMGIIAEA
jgi:hypothetical protein